MEAAESSTQGHQEWDRGLGRSSSTELEGAIPQLCSSRATAEISMMYTIKTRLEADEKKANIKQFFLDLSHVVNLAYEVLDKAIIKEYRTWRKSIIYDSYNSDENVRIAFDIEQKVQEDLYKKGYKDTNRSESLPYPIECYLSE